MANISRLQRSKGYNNVADHPDLNHAWCKEILSNPDIQWDSNTKNAEDRRDVSNSMFEYTLYSERGVRVHLSFQRPSKEPDAKNGWEACYLISIGDGVDGKKGRAHGGFSGVLLDHVSGHVANSASPRMFRSHVGILMISPTDAAVDALPPATATMTVDYKAPVETPCVILARGWMTDLKGRKVYTSAVLEDGTGKTLATARCLFILARQEKI